MEAKTRRIDTARHGRCIDRDLSLFTHSLSHTRFALNAGLVLLPEPESVGWEGRELGRGYLGRWWKRREREKREGRGKREIIGRRVEGLGCWASSPLGSEWGWGDGGKGSVIVVDSR